MTTPRRSSSQDLTFELFTAQAAELGFNEVVLIMGSTQKGPQMIRHNVRSYERVAVILEGAEGKVFAQLPASESPLKKLRASRGGKAVS